VLTEPVTVRALVVDAPAEVSAALANTPGLVLRPDDSAGFEAVIRLCPSPPSPFHRMQLLSEVRLDAISRAPVRYNAVIVGDVSPTADLVRFLAGASAVTGQVLAATATPPTSGTTA
jgi:hypothetical protein